MGYNNHEQTVGVGESKKYLWYADKEYVSCIIQSFGDMRNHRYHGLFGAIIIEPAGARWYKSFSPCKTIHDESAAIVAPGMENFRECVTFIQNGIRLLDKDGQLIKTAAGQENEEVDAEDTGEKGYNYRSERFANRLKRNSRISKIFSSRVHGDPATPLFKAYAKERVIFRTVIYLYRSGSLKWDVESGMWGLFRVVRQGLRCKCKNLYHTCRDACCKARDN